ncbi:hypothetical protein [Clostridium beijerinckii]|uniref:hypothetical protein n=1 Tax=Clostridium beijerinckii TaxID=1520 RepID=UPI00232DE9E1|nr:hypothetical protein [Clostridium beijerinckii]
MSHIKDMDIIKQADLKAVTVNQEVIQVIPEVTKADQGAMKVDQEVMKVDQEVMTADHKAMQAILTADHIVNPIADNRIIGRFL